MWTIDVGLDELKRMQEAGRDNSSLAPIIVGAGKPSLAPGFA
jgi:hypothetical protein